MWARHRLQPLESTGVRNSLHHSLYSMPNDHLKPRPRLSWRTAATTIVLLLGGAAQAAECLPADRLDALRQQRAAKWQPPADTPLDAQALALLPCLADADPAVRDAIAFEGLQAWMRAGRLQVSTIQAIRVRLLADLSAPDPRGFRPPFAALVLAEVARVDRMKPFLAADERADLVARAASYLSAVRDYRGFDAQEGWRHGVAHGADLALQLALNPQLTREQGEALLTAIAAQVMAADAHAYRYGEPERLMAPVFYLARRGWWTAADWERWLLALTARLPKANLFQSQAGLAGRHNLTAFLSALYLQAREGSDRAVEEAWLPGLRKALRELG